MALLTEVITEHGETKKAYLRINNVQVSNHGVKSFALIRGFVSEQAFRDGFNYIHEELIELDIDVSNNVWDQVYSELKGKYPEGVDA